MAKSSGLGDNFYAGGYDLSGDVASIDKLSGPLNLLEATGIKQLAEARIPGQREGMMQFSSYFENTGTTNTPSMPASGTPQVSTYNWPVFVTITGGTISNVTINGSTVGTTAGTYVLPALGTITITYSVAPTWAWTGVLTEHNALSTLPRTDVVGSYFRGAAVGAPACCCIGKQLNYDPTRDNVGNLTLSVTIQANAYGVEWGIQLTPGLRADTAATVGSFYDNGAAFNFGAQSYVNLVALVGTSVDISITHATTSGGSYTTLMDFGSFTGVGSARQSVSNTTTVNEFLKVVTTGTFTYAQFAVMINVNKAAGQVF